ncbi:MAG: hypothetical protein DRR04_11605 [Gammaproteobacteria bacterium]|nr:MAG: hypothetical protein DRR04_11605 [Gammaproteobacteria bacterium]
MRSKLGELTPREAALVITCGWIKAAQMGLTEDVNEMDDRESFRAQVKSALVKEYDRLSARVGSTDLPKLED